MLRVIPFSNTSHMVIWITKEGKRVVTAVKGAVRPKSFFLGQYDLYQTCELLYYGRSSAEVHPIREVSALELRSGLRTNWRAEFMASWFVTLTDFATNSDTAMPALYEHLEECLDELAAMQGAPEPLLLAYYEIKFLQESGNIPNFSGECSFCESASPILAEESALYYAEEDVEAASRSGIRYFSIPEGRCVCAKHAHASSLAPCIKVAPSVRVLFEGVVRARCYAELKTGLQGNYEGALRGVLRILGLFLRVHFPDLPEKGRRIIRNSEFGIDCRGWRPG